MSGWPIPWAPGSWRNPGLLSYLPRICEALLGETLQLPSQPTWWCGEREGLDAVLDRFEYIVLRSLDRSINVQVSSLDGAARETLQRQVRGSPEQFVGQLVSCGSTVPCLAQSQLVPKRIVTRYFVAREHDGFHAMPGGLSRPLELCNSVTPLRAVSGGTFKDTWVLAEDVEQAAEELVSPAAVVRLHKADESLPSRAAERLYNVGRLAEQTTCVVRAARSLINWAREGREFGDSIESASTLRFTTALAQLLETTTEQESLHQFLLRATYSVELPGSARAKVNGMLQAAYDVRHRWSADGWRILDDIGELTESDALTSRRSLDALETVYEQLLTALDAFSGITMESMTRGHGWHFLLIGRRLARASWMSRMLQYSFVDDPSQAPAPYLEGLLYANESLLTHRRRYLSFVSAPTVVDTLLLTANNPRSIIYQVQSLQRHIDALPIPELGDEFSLPRRAALELSTLLALADTDLATEDQDPFAQSLGTVLSETQRLIDMVQTGLHLTYFAHVAPPRQLRADDTGILRSIDPDDATAP